MSHKLLAVVTLFISVFGCSHAPVQRGPMTPLLVMEISTTDQITWQINERFRLLAGDRAEEWARRVADYVKHGNCQDNSPRLPTHWDASSAAYEPGYGRGQSVALNASAPSSFVASPEGKAGCDWFIDGVHLEEKRCAGATIPSCAIGGCHAAVETHVGQQVKRAELRIVPRHIVIATLGDSYASGEGVPDERASGLLFWTRHNPLWLDARCHRSLYSGHALAAFYLSLVEPHSIVTYASFACSGALLSSGLVDPYPGAEPDSEVPLPPQIDQLI